MITIHLLAPNGAETTLQARAGDSLMQAAVAANVPWIAADCGGMLTCATCHVYVGTPFAERLPAPKEDELAMLEFAAAERRPTSRLSCQIELTPALDGLTAELPPTQY